MKKNSTLLLILILFISMATQTFAQTTKGKFVVGGSTGIQFSSSSVKSVYDGVTEDKTTISSLSIVPSFAYFVMDDVAIGLTSTFTTSTSKNDNGSKNTANTVMLIPTALYYFPMEGKIRPIVQLGIGLSSQSEKYVPKTGSEDKTSISGLAINFGGGFCYFLKDNISMNFGLSYTLANLKDGDDTKAQYKQGSIASNIGLSIYF